MRTDQRLTQAYESARVVPLDATSRFVFLSDCHRGDGSLSDDFTRNQNIYLHALECYFEQGYVYVEVGDGDELWEHDIRHIKNAHYQVYETIRKFATAERFILIWGNHNVQISRRQYVEKNYYTYFDAHTQESTDFLRGVEPCEAIILRDAGTGWEALVLHGHQGDFLNDQAWFLTMLSVKYFWRFLHAFGIRNPASPVKNVPKRHKIEKNYNRWIARHKRPLICGHTHRFKYPRSDEPPYFNTGNCIYPTSISAIEIVDGVIQLVRWQVRVNREGVLQVERDVLTGPEPLGMFVID
ncbi:MAG: serine/threonine protein phosphatase [Actinobacteria bacterium HGW-Actinobacteria-10]|jgi:UDP-2,3-diacylglucosamine pyrophosphatase LpxH|nr:MAG: serine/threonine protein phosphatase [Actinobacteria bacterium HGW-Actinobacteria-10]